MHVEICEDVWVPIPPSTYAALAGATVEASASNITVEKASIAANTVVNPNPASASPPICAAGPGESTTDLAWDGQALICENDGAKARRR